MSNGEDHEDTHDDPTLGSLSHTFSGEAEAIVPSLAVTSNHTVQPIAGTASPDSSASVPTAFPRIDGYHVIAKLGQGGMGTVYRASQLATRREVALKLMSVRALGSDKARRRFEREVELASSLEHSNIARVFDSGLAKNVYFYAMQLVPGVPLDRHVEINQLDERAILEVFLKVCRAIEFAHRKGVIHRDLKPSNIMVTPAPESEPFVLDFGLAKTLIDDGEHLTVSQEGDLTGTPAYMSPEQASGHVHSIDTRTDVYALGVILFRLVTNDHPHDLTGSAFDLTKRIIELDPKRPRNIKVNLDRDLEAILLKCLEKQPAHRYGSAGGLAEDIQKYLNKEPISAQPATASYFLKKKLARHKPLVALAAVLFILFNSAALFYVWSINAEQARTDQARQKAVANEAKAKAEAERATKAEADAEDERDTAIAERERATKAESVASAQAETNRRQLYFNLIRLAQAELDAGNMTRATELLDSCPPDLRDWEWPLLHRIAHVPPRTLPGIAHVAETAAWSPDGRMIVASSSTGKIVCFDVASGKIVANYSHPKSVTLLRFHPKGDWIASAGHDTAIHIWNPRDGMAIRQIEVGHPVWALDVSADGNLLAAGQREQAPVRVWNTSNWQEVAQIPARIASVGFNGAVAFNPDGKLLAICEADNRGVSIWSLESPSVRLHTWPSGGCHSLFFSPDGFTLYVSDQHGFLIGWDVSSGNVRFVTSVQSKHAQSMLAPDGKLIASSYWNNVSLHDAQTGRTLKTFRVTGRDNMRRPFFSPDGNVVAAVDLNRVCLWNVNGTPAYKQLKESGFAGGSGMALSPDGQWLAARAFGHLGVWHLPTGLPMTVQSAPYFQGGLAFAADSNSLLTLDGGRVFQMDLSGFSKKMQAIPTLGNDVSHLATSSRGDLAISTKDVALQVWKASMAKPHWEQSLSGICFLSFSTDGRIVACGLRGALRLYDSESGELLKSLAVQGTSGCAAFNPRGDRLVVGSQHAIYLFEWPLGSQIWRSQAHDSAVTAVDWHPDGRRFISSSGDGRVMLWTPEDSQPLLTLKADGPVGAAFFSRDGETIYNNRGAWGDGIRRWSSSFGQVAPVGKAINLLTIADPLRDSLRGVWTNREGTFRTDDAAPATLAIPVVCDGDYDLVVEFRRRKGNESFGVNLPVGQTSVRLTIDGWNMNISGLGLIDGKDVDANATRTTVTLKNDVLNRLQIKMRLSGLEAHVTATLNSRKIVDWRGPLSQLQHQSADGVRPFNSLGFASWKSEYEISRAEMTAINQPAKYNAEGVLVPSLPFGMRRALVGEEIDLLSHVDRQRDVVNGGWTKTDEGLRLQPILEGRITLPVKMKPPYRLSTQFHRVSGEEGPIVVLPTGTRQVLLVVSGWGDRQISGLGVVDGKDSSTNGTGVKTTLVDGKTYQLDVEVKNADGQVQIEASLDGKKLVSWQGDESLLSVPSLWTLTHASALGIGASNTDIVFRSIKLKMLDGEAWVLPAAAPIDP